MDKKQRILWGGATASSQYEGGFTDSKGLDTQDCRAYLPRTSNATEETRLLTKEKIEEAKRLDSGKYYPFRNGAKGFEHLEEDIEYLDELGLDLYRFSISWARLFPNGVEEVPSPEGVAYYDRVFNLLTEKKIKIFLTLNHYAMPIYLVEQYGGWKGRECIEHFMRFATFVFERWGNLVEYWLPFNEINAGYFSPYNGVGLLKGENGFDLTDVFQALHHQFVASAKTIKLAREMKLPGRFGSMIACFCYYPLTSRPEDNLKLVFEEQMNQWYCMDILSKGEYPYYAETFFKNKNIVLNITDEDKKLLKENTCDFVSISFYTSSVITVEEADKTAGNLVVSTKNPYLKASEWGWQIDPVGLRTSLHKVYERYGKPVIVSENGLGARDVLTENGEVHDEYRIDYMKSYYEQAQLALEDGVPLEAYIAWGIIDIVSAGSCEMDKRYGVIYVDADNLGNGSYKRYKKDSFYWYKDFIQKYREENDG